MDIIIINYCDTNSWQSTPTMVAAAVDEDAAMRWVQDEVDGKHNSGVAYAQGTSAQWWIDHRTFRLNSVKLND